MMTECAQKALSFSSCSHNYLLGAAGWINIPSLVPNVIDGGPAGDANSRLVINVLFLYDLKVFCQKKYTILHVE